MIPFSGPQKFDGCCYAMVVDKKGRERRCLQSGRYRLQAASGHQFLVCGTHKRSAFGYGTWLSHGGFFDFHYAGNLRMVTPEEMRIE